MARDNLLLLTTFICSTLLSGCLQNVDTHFSTSTPTLSETPTVTPTPTFTLTPSITPTSTMIATPSATPYPLAICMDNKSYIATWSTELEEMQFEAFVCNDNTLIAIFYNQEIGETITINQGTSGRIEFAWQALVDVDSDESTGSTNQYWFGIAGADYGLSLARWVRGIVKTVPFIEAFQIDVWKFEPESANKSSNGELYVDHANKTIVLRGIVPQINANSRLVFFRYSFRSDDRLSYETDWINSNSIP